MNLLIWTSHILSSKCLSLRVTPVHWEGLPFWSWGHGAFIHVSARWPPWSCFSPTDSYCSQEWASEGMEWFLADLVSLETSGSLGLPHRSCQWQNRHVLMFWNRHVENWNAKWCYNHQVVNVELTIGFPSARSIFFFFPVTKTLNYNSSWAWHEVIFSFLHINVYYLPFCLTNDSQSVCCSSSGYATWSCLGRQCWKVTHQ